MKKPLLLSFVLVVSFCFTSSAQIAGTSHDFSSQAWAPASNTMCAVCHTTHNATTIPSAPLWDHETTTVSGYSLYSSSTFDSHGGTSIADPSASSKLCLSCHDGTVALENFGNTTTGTNFIDAAYNIGGIATGDDLSDDHPISFDYTTALSTLDGGLHDPSTTSSGLGGTIAQDMLFDNKMQCASCHDVHNKFGISKLLKMDNENSQLCLTCHDK